MNSTYKIAGIIILTLILIYYLWDPSKTDWLPHCPLHLSTGLLCPGCGGQQTFHHFLHFEFSKAFIANPLLFILIPYLALYLLHKKINVPLIPSMLFKSKAAWVLLFLIVSFWVLRNVL